MKRFILIATLVTALGFITNAQATETTFKIGGGLSTNSAGVGNAKALGFQAALDFSLGESPFALGIFGEGNFSERAGKPILGGVNFLYKVPVGGSHSGQLEPKLYFGPSVGVASILRVERKMALHLGANIGLEFPLSEHMGLFGNAKYAWAQDNDGSVEMLKGFSTYVGLTFNLGN